MTAQYGAHEVLELHEVLDSMVNGINTFQLYRNHVQDQQLAQILDRQLGFAAQEYDSLVNALQQKGMQQAVPYRALKAQSPKYGLRQPGPVSPNASANELDDRDIASCVMDWHKSMAVKKMHASLECADPHLRRMLQQGAINCGEQAFETWQYMNQHGYYQVPTMKEMTTQTLIQTYQQAPTVLGTYPQTPVHETAYGYQNVPVSSVGGTQTAYGTVHDANLASSAAQPMGMSATTMGTQMKNK
jgi:spore coat protein CotF